MNFVEMERQLDTVILTLVLRKSFRKRGGGNSRTQFRWGGPD